jgi:hypothetical protein
MEATSKGLFRSHRAAVWVTGASCRSAGTRKGHPYRLMTERSRSIESDLPIDVGKLKTQPITHQLAK